MYGNNFSCSKLRMRKQYIKRAVTLDALEPHTERCSPRFRTGGRLCQQSFKYLSQDSGGERRRSLDNT